MRWSLHSGASHLRRDGTRYVERLSAPIAERLTFSVGAIPPEVARMIDVAMTGDAVLHQVVGRQNARPPARSR